MNTFLVIDIGGTHIKFGVMEHGTPRVLGRHVPARSLCSDDPVMKLARHALDACQQLRLERGRIDAIVVTVPGFLDTDRDYIHFCDNVPQLNGHRLASELSAYLQIPVYLERDVILLLQGEWCAGAGKNAHHLLGVFFGTGVGAAFLEHGRPFRGSGFALEIGHIPFRGAGHSLARPGFMPLSLENHISGRALEAIAARHGTEISRVFAVSSGQPVLAQEIDEFIRGMAMVTAIAVTLFSPERVVIGGGICHMEGFPDDFFMREVAAMVPMAHIGVTLDLHRDELGWQAVLHGAKVRLAQAATAM